MREVRSIWYGHKSQWDNKEEDGYRAESEKESCVKENRQIFEERGK